MHFTHLFDFIEVHDEAPLISMVFLDAFSTENGQVIGAIEVLDSLIMLVAEKAINNLFIFKVDIS